MRNDYFDDLVPAVPGTSPVKRGRLKACNGGHVPAVPDVPGNFTDVVRENDEVPLAAKLRALGQPIALEVDGEVFCWLVADDEAAQRADVDGVVCTAAEAEVLAQFDADGIRELTRMKRALGGTISSDEDNR